jgi:NADH:ubiquinone oxidoreductase subunit
MGLLSPIVNLLGVLSPVHIHFVTLVTGARYAGSDSAGNKYYTARPRKGYKLDRRWVIYKGVPEASNVPPEWHGWLHHQTDAVPDGSLGYRRLWQKPHQPNLTGTNAAYRPPGHILAGGKRDKATGDYEAWKPE